MLIATVSTIISLIFLIAFVAAMIILQVYLSRRESKLPGLVLPAITFSGELFILLNVVTNVVMTSVADNAVGGVDSYDVFVTVLNTGADAARYLHADHRAAGDLLPLRRGMNRKKQIEKMNIQDLWFFRLNQAGHGLPGRGTRGVDTCGFHPLVNHPFPWRARW